MENLGERIRQLRIENNKTQSELADILNIDRSNYSKYELGKLEVRNDMLIALAKYYSVTTDYLLGLEN